jgi:hypothetical protein
MPLHNKYNLTGYAHGRKDRTMNEKEKKEFYVANCKCCLLADVMKTCPVCRFNIGLVEKQEAMQPIPVSIPVRVDLFLFTDQQ